MNLQTSFSTSQNLASTYYDYLEKAEAMSFEPTREYPIGFQNIKGVPYEFTRVFQPIKI